MYDVIIVGGGPAGLSAALVLGRCRRRVLVCDSGRPRNGSAAAVHGYLTRDGIDPAEFRRIGREQLAPYATVEFLRGEVADAYRRDGGFEVLLRDGAWHSSRALLLAAGVVDELPRIEGIEEFYGRSVFHCPYCDGWEVRDEPLALYKPGGDVKTALELTVWSRDVVLCTDGPADLTDGDRRRLARHGVTVHEGEVVRLEGRDGRLERLVFADGESLPRRAMFFGTTSRPQSDLAEKLGCRLGEEGTADIDPHGSAGVPGLFVAGDAAGGVQMAIVAAAEGLKAAEAVNAMLTEEDTA